MARCACGTASTPPSTDLFPCFYGGGGSCAFDRAQVPGAGRLRRSARALLPGRYRPRATWPGSAAGRCSTSRAAWSTTSTAAPSASVSARTQSRRCSRRTPCCSAGRTSTNGARLAAHFAFAWAGALLSVLFGDVAGRPNLAALWRAFLQLPRAVRSRWRARALAASRHGSLPPSVGRLFPRPLRRLDAAPERLRVLFVSPYPICPPIHGGGVFMYQTLRELARLAEVHVVVLLDLACQERENEELRELLRLRRMAGAPRRASRTARRRSRRTPCASSTTKIWSG